MTTNRPRHNFTLAQRASDIVNRTKDGYKSDMVSRAIIWFNQDVNELRLQNETLERTIIVLREKLAESDRNAQKWGFWSKLFKK
jgi:hypothetical protein